MAKCNIFNQNGSSHSRQRVVTLTFCLGCPQIPGFQWLANMKVQGPGNDDNPRDGGAVVFRGVDRLWDFLKQIEHNKQLPGQKLTLSSCVFPKPVEIHFENFATEEITQNPPRYPFGNQVCTKPWDASFHQELLPRSTIFLETPGCLLENVGWMEIFLWKIKTHGNCGCFFSIEKCEKKVNLGKKLCCQQKSLEIFREFISIFKLLA